MKEEQKKDTRPGKIEPQKKDTIITKIKNHPFIAEIIVVLFIASAVATLLIWIGLSSRIYIEKAQIYAPSITIKPVTPGILEKIKVKEGDSVGKGTVLATIGGKEIQSETKGVITYVNNVPGQYFGTQDILIKMFDPDEMRVIGRVEEDKGLSEIKVGQNVKFTVDAYGSKSYSGVIESIASAARDSDIVFSISSQREVKEFEVKATFNVESYPELKNGMSAKMWVYK